MTKNLGIKRLETQVDLETLVKATRKDETDCTLS
jgi:hypothetical protein